MLPLGAPSLHFQNPTFGIPFEHIPSRHTFVGPMDDPAAVAGRGRGDTRVTIRDSRKLNAARELDALLVGTASEVWPLPDRPVEDRQHHRRIGIRLGPHASTGGANYMVSVKSTPPAPRKAEAHEISSLRRERWVAHRPRTPTPN